jgi:hypothetical protein
MSSRIRGINRLGLIAVAAGLLIVATALSSLAAPKVFTWTVSGGPFAAGSTGNVTVTVTNNTPSATINSFSVLVPNGLTVQAPASPASVGASCNSNPPPCLVPPPASSGGSTNPNASATVTVSGQTIKVQFLDPVKNGQKAVLRIAVTAKSDVACGGTSVSWPGGLPGSVPPPSVVAWTGSNLSGSNFDPGTSSGTTSVTKTCSLSFDPGPTDGVAGQALDPVTVKTSDSGTTSVTLTLNQVSGTGTLSGTTTGSTAGGSVTFSDLVVSAPGRYTLTATDGTTYSSATSGEFKVFANSFGDGNCTASFPASDSTGGTGVDITAGDGTTCGTVPYTITASAGNVDFEKDASSTDQFAVTIAWGQPVPSGDPQSANTSITVNGTTYTHEQIPACPDGGAGYPAATATPPWCISSYNWDGTTLTQTFHGTGDPSFTRTK